MRGWALLLAPLVLAAAPAKPYDPNSATWGGYHNPPPPPPALFERWQPVFLAARAAGLSGRIEISEPEGWWGDNVGPGDKKCWMDRCNIYSSTDAWRFASVTKQIVAVAAMREVEEGRLQLDAPVARYLPGNTLANGGRVTVRQLLQHTSGLPNPEDGPTIEGIPTLYARATPPPEPGVPAVCLGPAKAEPGARFEYNNCDYHVLGELLEAVSGYPLAELLQRHVLTPAGMMRTRMLKPGEDAGRSNFDAAGKPDSAIDPGRFGAAGGLAGPASDLAAFNRALMAGRLLKPESRAEMWRGDPKLGFAALGQWSYTIPLKGCATPQRIVERRGEIGGVQVRNLIAPERQIALIAFADRPVTFGEPWQGRGLTHDLLAAALCPERPT